MFSRKKPLSLFLAFILCLQQGAFASGLDMARAADARRFAIQKTNSGEPVKLESSGFEKLEKFRKKTKSNYRIRMNGKTKNPRSLVGGDNIKVGRGDSSALKFIKSNKELLGVNEKDLKLARKPLQSAIGTHFYFRQYYKKLPVENVYVKVNVDKGGNLINYQSTYIPDLSVDTKESISAEQAAQKAAEDAGGVALNVAQKVIYANPESIDAKLAWKVLVQGGENAPAKWDYYVDAQNGEILNRISKLLYASKAAEFSIEINPVYPGAAGFSTQTLPIRDMYVYSFDSSGNPQASQTTDANGRVSVGGRMWATYSGPYFTVSNEHDLTNYYVERGMKDGIAETFSTSDWGEFSKGSDWSTYNACDTGLYPVFSYPVITGFNMGAMNNSGEITDKKFLLLGSNLPSTRILGAYIGQFSSINGPLVPNYTTSQTLSLDSYPAGAVGAYTINKFKKLCIPSSSPDRYSDASGTLSVNLATDNVPVPEAVVFYNLNEMRHYFVDLANDSNFKLDGHMPVVVNASGYKYTNGNDGMQNAFYDIDADLILIGQGLYNPGEMRYRSLALESAIVRHEYTHAVMNKIWPILYFDEGAAIAEGVADYFALSSNTDSGGNPYTSVIGDYVGGSSGEGMSRNLSGTLSYTPAQWIANGAPMGQHANSLFLSQALWDLRKSTTPTVSSNADKLVWYALMFFPDSLLEFRDGMVAAAKIVGGDALVNAVETAFNAHGINYDNIITSSARTDIYEPNNGPDSAADIDIASIAKRELNGTLYPAGDIDFYSISLPEGQFKAVLSMPVVDEAPSNMRYMPLGLLLLDANMQTAVDLIRPPDMPSDQSGSTGLTTGYQNITLTFDAPSLLNGNTGRYILGVYKLNNGFYPNSTTIDNKPESVAYKLSFTFTNGSNIGLVQTKYENFSDGQVISFDVPYSKAEDNGLNNTLSVLGLSTWRPSDYEAIYSGRLLDSDLNPIAGADTGSTYLSNLSNIHVYAGNNITGDITIQNGFNALGHNVVYLQLFGKLRSWKANNDVPDANYRSDYGVVSMGISNPIMCKSTTGEDVYIKQGVFNPMQGGKLKMQVAAKENGNMKVQLFTVDGLLVKTIYDGPAEKSFPTLLEWDGRNEKGNIVASSVYLLRIDGAGLDRVLKKVVVVK